MSSISRNSPCPCGSGKKYKNCCLNGNNNKINPDRFYKYEYKGEEKILFEYPNVANVFTSYRKNIDLKDVERFNQLIKYINDKVPYTKSLEDDPIKYMDFSMSISLLFGIQFYDFNYYDAEMREQLKLNKRNILLLKENFEKSWLINYNLGIYFYSKGKFEYANKFFFIALQNNPFPSNSALLIAIAKSYSGLAIKLKLDYYKSLSWESKVLEKPINTPEIENYFNQANDYFIKAYEGKANNWEFYNDWAANYSEWGYYDKAMEKYALALEKGGMNSFITYGLAVINIRLSNFNEAEKYFKEHLKYFKEDKVNIIKNKITYSVIGYCYYKLNKTLESIDYYKKALSFDEKDDFIKKTIEILEYKLSESKSYSSKDFDELLSLYTEDLVKLSDEKEYLKNSNARLLNEIERLKSELLTKNRDNNNPQINSASIQKIKIPFTFCIFGEVSDKNILFSELNNYFLKFGISANQWKLDIFSNRKLKKEKILSSVKLGKSKYQLIISGQLHNHSNKGDTFSNLFSELSKNIYVPFIKGCEPQKLLTSSNLIEALEQYFNKNGI